MIDFFITLIRKLRSKWYFQLFVIYLRYALGIAFIIGAIVMGKLSPSENVGSTSVRQFGDLERIEQFWYVMSSSGLYWNFIGWGQIIAGGLLITQKYAKLGVLIFLPMIGNIFIITVSYGFIGTPIVTGLMLLGAIFLVLWDIESFQFFIRDPKKENITDPVSTDLINDKTWIFTGLIMIVTVILLGILKINPIYQLTTVFFEGILGLIIHRLIFGKDV